MFAHNFKENLTNVVTIKDVKFEVFQELLRFIYAGKVQNMEKVCFDLLQAAEMVRIHTVSFNFMKIKNHLISVRSEDPQETLHQFHQNSNFN
jgi:hypothetical protein